MIRGRVRPRHKTFKVISDRVNQILKVKFCRGCDAKRKSIDCIQVSLLPCKSVGTSLYGPQGIM